MNKSLVIQVSNTLYNGSGDGEVIEKSSRFFLT